MKNIIKFFLQKILGFKNFLFFFSLYKILTLKFDKNEGVFLKLLDLLPEDAIVLDIGANIGVMTVLLAKKCRKGKVYSFEPIDENYETILRVVKFFKLLNVTTEKIALGSTNESVKMILPVINSVKLQGLPHVLTSTSIENGVEYEVEQKTLDSIWNNCADKITAIKIDVENYEFQVFKGAVNLLRKNLPIIYVELWDNENRKKSFDLLNSLSYKAQIYNDGFFSVLTPNESSTNNFFFFPN